MPPAPRVTAVFCWGSLICLIAPGTGLANTDSDCGSTQPAAITQPATTSLHPIFHRFADPSITDAELRHAVQNLLQEILHQDRLSLDRSSSEATPAATAASRDTQESPFERSGPANRQAIIAQLVQSLLQRLQRAESRIWVTHTLGKLGRHSEPAVTALRVCLNDETSPLELRLVTLDALTAIAREVPAAAAAVAKFAAHVEARETSRKPDVGIIEADLLARHVQHELFLAALRAVGELGPNTASSLPVLMRGLDHPATDVRLTAAESIGTMGTVADQAANRLTEVAFGDDDSDVRSAAKFALSQIGPAGLEQIRTMLHAESIENRRVAWEILATARAEFVSRSFDPAIADSLRPAEDPAIRASAATTAAKQPTLRLQGLDAAVELLESPQRIVRQRAAAVLSNAHPIPDVVYNRVKELTTNRDPAVRTTAQRLIARWPLQAKPDR